VIKKSKDLINNIVLKSKKKKERKKKERIEGKEGKKEKL
jgi:hypothetical protein